jgi:hypothetical protein
VLYYKYKKQYVGDIIMSEIIAYERKLDNVEQNSIQVPEYRNFWLRGFEQKKKVSRYHYIGVFTDDIEVETRILDIDSDGNVKTIVIPTDVEDIIKTVKKLLKKLDSVDTLSLIGWQEQVREIFEEKLKCSEIVYNS